ncbi:MAG: hypothetical protein OXG44_09185 [Gammaproteobacteria bacterium]|nr:hypothetical protein [Gammaproteobacteria bacterium]
MTTDSCPPPCPGHVADTESELRAMMADCPACRAITYPETP